MKNNRKRLIIVGSVLLLVVIAVVLCFYQRKKRTFTINIRIPAGAEEGYYYTDEDMVIPITIYNISVRISCY